MARGSHIFNIGEAAAFLGAHEQTVRKLARRAGIPAFKVGKDWRFHREALVRWSEEQQRGRGPCSALVVDDDERICRAICRMLERFGCRARQTTSAKEGLELVHAEPPDLILLDLKMPDMSGPQFLAELRKTHPQLPVVIVTGYPDSELMKEAAQYAPLMLLAKPVEAALLERTVRTVIGEKLPRATPAELEAAPFTAASDGGIHERRPERPRAARP
jgi:excisionase family DNA binding protein